MSDNKNNNRDEQSDRKSQEQKEQGGKKKPELDPNNPKANQKDQQGSNAPRSESESTISDAKGTTSKLN